MYLELQEKEEWINVGFFNLFYLVSYFNTLLMCQNLIRQATCALVYKGWF